ncbi:MAG: N-acetylneuraminate synthase family protein [Anaerolineales bacterium]
MFVAEAGSLHKGNTALACEIVRQFAFAGADIVKFQLGWPEDDHLRHVGIDMAEHIADYCRAYDVEFMASIWSQEGLKIARDVGMRRYKVAAQKSYDDELLEQVLADGKTVFVSGRRMSGTVPIFCQSLYPVYPWKLQMPQAFREWYGYSDHSHGIAACLLAISRGAKYIEKHVCLDKTDLATRDSPFSATPDEFAELAQVGGEIARLIWPAARL